MNPTPAFLAKLEQRLTEYRNMAITCPPERCRLVQYTGAGKPNGFDLSPEQIEGEISFSLAAGLTVDWFFENCVLYIRTQEPDCPIPPWGKVKAEEALIDVDALLRDAGL